jgi:chloramphenicol 3-O phosphotransferase
MKESVKIPPGTVIFLNGTSNSGKTSLLKSIQDIFEEPFLDLGLDKFIYMLPRRYLKQPLWNEVLGKATSSGSMGNLLVKSMHRTILEVSSQGNNVVADHVLIEPKWVQECACMFFDRPAWLVAVRCPLTVVEERERKRKNRTLGQARAQYELVHKHVVYDIEVDTADQSPQECAEHIKDAIYHQVHPKAFTTIKNRLP